MRTRGLRRLVRVEVLGLIAVAAVAALAAIPAFSADHLDAPAVKKDGRIDINDIYVFHPSSTPATENLSRTVLAMTVNPAAGVISGTTFRQGAKYEFLVDTNGDAKPEMAIRTQFSGPNSNRQSYTVHRDVGDDSTLIAKGQTDEVATLGAVSLFAGLRDVGVWGRTVVGGQQVERMGRPAILTVFIPPNPFEAGSAADGNLEDQFNATTPDQDQARWRSEIVNSLTLLYSLNDATDANTGDDAGTVQTLANILLPDILTVNVSQATGFLNGRNLTDDVIDAELGIVTEGLITSDCVANDSTFLSSFPYLGVPNT